MRAHKRLKKKVRHMREGEWSEENAWERRKYGELTPTCESQGRSEGIVKEEKRGMHPIF
jgi:hypothetical protein